MYLNCILLYIYIYTIINDDFINQIAPSSCSTFDDSLGVPLYVTSWLGILTVLTLLNRTPFVPVGGTVEL